MPEHCRPEVTSTADACVEFSFGGGPSESLTVDGLSWSTAAVSGTFWEFTSIVAEDRG